MIFPKAENPLFLGYFIIKTIFTCLKDVIKHQPIPDLIDEGLHRNNGILYYSVITYTNNKELTQYCQFYLPLEDTGKLENVNELICEYCGYDLNFVQNGHGKTNYCILLKDLDFMYLQNALNDKYKKPVKLICIDDKDKDI